MEQKYIKDNDGNKILPITSVTAVRDANGQTLAAKIEELELKSDGNNNLIKTEESRAKDAESSLHSSVVSTNNALNTERSERTAAEAQLRAELNAKQYEAEAIELDAVPTKDSTKMVNSGAVYTALQDMVYDVSVKHPASGVDSGNTYTLNGALAVIPAADRKAGMSIKFIDSEKNEYVQYRFLGATTDGFINVANWQGVDDEPTAGSRNLVESGVVYDKTQVYDSCIGQVKTANLFDKTKIIAGSYVNRINGLLRTTSGTADYFTTDFILIDSAGCYAPKALVGGTYFGWACYSAASEDSYTHGGSINPAVYQEGDAYVRFSGNLSELDTYMVVRGNSAADVPSEYEPYGYLGSLKDDTVGTNAIKNKAVTAEKLSDDALDEVKVPIYRDVLIEDYTYTKNNDLNSFIRQLSLPNLDITKEYRISVYRESGHKVIQVFDAAAGNQSLFRYNITKDGITQLDTHGFVWFEGFDAFGDSSYRMTSLDTFKVVNCANNMNARQSRIELGLNIEKGTAVVDVMWNLPNVLKVDSTYRFWYNENTLIRDYDILFKNGHYFNIETDCSSNNMGEGYGNVLCDGTYIKFSVYRKNYDNTSTEITSHTIILDVGTKLTNVTKNVIFVGDSYTNSKWGKKGLIGYVQEFAEADGNTVVSKGIRTVYDETKAEGYNGYSVDDFLAYTPTDQRPADWPNTPSLSGVPKQSPFMFSADDTAANAKFNFAKYLTDYNIGQVDCIVLFLGINGGTYNTLRNMIQGSDSTFVSSFRAALPNVKIIVVNLPAYYGFKTLSDVAKNNGNNDRIGRNNNYIKYLAGKIENVVIAPTNEMERIYGYRISDTLQTWTQFQNDSEVDNDVEIPKNYIPKDIHPSTSGIKSIAYSVYHCLFVGD